MAKNVDYQSLSETRTAIAERYLTSKDISEKMQGISFVLDEYENIVSETSEGAYSENCVTLFFDVMREFYRSVKEINTEDLYRLGTNENLIDLILLTAYRIKVKGGEQFRSRREEGLSEGLFLERDSQYKTSPDVSALINYESRLGWLINWKKQTEGKFEPAYWGRVFDQFGFYFSVGRHEIEKNNNDDSRLLQWQAVTLFNYASGLLMNHCTDLIQNYYYKNLRDHGFFQKISHEEQDAFLSIYILNYIVAYESQYASEEVVRENKELIESKEAASAIDGFFSYLIDYDECPSFDRLEDIGIELNRHIPWPDGIAGTLTDTAEITRRFYLFIILYLAWKGLDQKIIDEKLDVAEYHGLIQMADDDNRYYVDSHEIIKKFYLLMKPRRQEVDKDVDDMLEPFYASMERRYKEHELAEATKDNIQLTDEKIKELEENTSKTITDKAVEKFTPISGAEIEHSVSSQSEYLFQFSAPTQFFEKEIINQSVINSVDNNIYNWMYEHLEKQKLIDSISVREDKDILDLLKRYDTIIGAGFWISSLRYRYGKEAAELADSKKIIDLNIGGMLLLDSSKVQLEINGIYGKIKPVQIDEVRTEKDADGTYKFTYVSGYPITFTEEELKKFLAESLKRIGFYGNLTLRTVQGENVGVFIKREY